MSYLTFCLCPYSHAIITIFDQVTKNMTRLLLILILGSCFTASAQIQITRDVIGASGTEFSNTNLGISFTIGETFTSTFGLGSTQHSLGFQQSDLSFASVHELNNDVVTIYPNPTSQQLTLTTSSEIPFLYHIYDVVGRVVWNGRSQNSVLTLDVTSIGIGKYIIEYIPESGQTQYLPFIKIK